MTPFQHSLEALEARARKDVLEASQKLKPEDFVDTYLIEHKNGQKLWWDVYRITLVGKPCFMSMRKKAQTETWVIGPIMELLEQVLHELRTTVEPCEVEP